MLHTKTAVILAVAILAAGAQRARAQQPADPRAAAGASLGQCIAAAEGGRELEAKTAADRAETLYREWMKAAPRDAAPRVGLANVQTRCRIPFAEMMSKGELLMMGNALLEEALQLDSTHWEARFSLAMNHFHTPAFMGKTGDAIRQLEILVAQQGNRADSPRFAMPYLYLGDVYRRASREADARAIWQRAAALFPADARFQQRLSGAPAAPAGGAPAAPASGTAGAAQPGAAGAVSAAAGQRGQALTLAPLVADGGNRLDDTRSRTALRRLDVLLTPGATADVMQAFQTMPGTTRAGDGADLYVRGGDPAEAPVYLDGSRLVYPGRHENLNGAVFGILDSNVLKSAYFASGGFSARYGDALSGVLDLETKDRPVARRARVMASTVQLGLNADLPLGRRVGAWSSIRATDAGVMLAMHGRAGEFAEAPFSAEGVAGMVWEPRAGTQVRLTALADGDRSAKEVDYYGWSGPFRSRGMNRLATLTARTVSADGARGLRASLSATRRTTGYEYGVLDRERTDRAARARVDGDLAWGQGGRLRGGLEGAWMDARQAGALPTSDRLSPGSPVDETVAADDASHLGGYVEAERPLGSAVAVIAGIRADRLPGESAWMVDPRLALAVRAGDWTLRAAGGVFHQGRWRTKYQLPDAGAPGGTPREAAHLVVGAERGGEPSVKAEAFLKDYGAYVQSGDGAEVVDGRVAGLDAIVRWSRQKTVNGWITYSYLDGTVALADGRTVSSSIDVTHSLTGVARITLPRSWELGSTARLATGRPFTPITGVAAGKPVYGEPNGARMPTYQRLDARITRYIPMRAGLGVVYLEMLNLLDRENVQAYTYGPGYATRTAVPSFFADRTFVLGMGLTF